MTPNSTHMFLCVRITKVHHLPITFLELGGKLLSISEIGAHKAVEAKDKKPPHLFSCCRLSSSLKNKDCDVI